MGSPDGFKKDGEPILGSNGHPEAGKAALTPEAFEVRARIAKLGLGPESEGKAPSAKTSQRSLLYQLFLSDPYFLKTWAERLDSLAKLARNPLMHERFYELIQACRGDLSFPGTLIGWINGREVKRHNTPPGSAWYVLGTTEAQIREICPKVPIVLYSADNQPIQRDVILLLDVMKDLPLINHAGHYTNR